MANSAAIAFAPHPRFVNSRIAVTISPSTTGTSAMGDTRTPCSRSIRPLLLQGVRISVARGSISLSLYTLRAGEQAPNAIETIMRHPDHSINARTRRHSADAALSERDGRRTQTRIGGELEKPGPTTAT